MTDHAVDFGVDQLLRGSRALLGVACIVFSDQFKLDRFAANLDAFGVELFDGQTGTVLVVFAQVGNRTTDGGNVTNFDNFLRHHLGRAKQRAMIAMALVNSPELIILDEPTTALDVTIQAEVLDMLDEIIHEEHLSVLFISHDLGVVSRMCDSVAVMNKGKIVEAGPVKEILSRPKNAYTVSLLDSVRALS